MAAAVLLAACGSDSSPAPSQPTDLPEQGRLTSKVPDLQDSSPRPSSTVAPQVARGSPPPDNAAAATVRESAASAKTTPDALPAATYEGTGASSAKRVEVDFDINRLIVLLALDDILPFYDPEFVSASNNPLEDEDLVLGLALNGEAKAYSVGVLDHREMVNDTVGGVPVLVTW